MDTVELLQRYTDEVWNAGDAERIRAFVTDPCWRHEPGGTHAVSADDNVTRVATLLTRFPGLHITVQHVVVGGEYAVARYTLRWVDEAHGDQAVGGIEVFRIVHGRITEVWNTPPGDGAWADAR